MFLFLDGAIIGICDKLFTRIHTRETASLAQSSFMVWRKRAREGGRKEVEGGRARSERREEKEG